MFDKNCFTKINAFLSFFLMNNITALVITDSENRGRSDQIKMIVLNILILLHLVALLIIRKRF